MHIFDSLLVIFAIVHKYWTDSEQAVHGLIPVNAPLMISNYAQLQLDKQGVVVTDIHVQFYSTELLMNW